MSVRAYRINKIEQEKKDTFNLWRNQALAEYLCIFDDLNEGTGISEVSVGLLQEALEEDRKDLPLEDFEIKAIKKDIAWAIKQQNDYIQYYCF